MMRVYERLLKYVCVPTASSETSGTVPTTQCQFNLAHMLVDEMKKMGIEDAHVDDKCYVYGTIPATPGYEGRTKTGLYCPYGYCVRFCRQAGAAATASGLQWG